MDRVRETRYRLDGTQIAVAVIAYVVGGWRLVILSTVVMWGWAFVLITLMYLQDRRRARQAVSAVFDAHKRGTNG